MQMALPPHSLHRARLLPCSQIALPPHCLHSARPLPCSQTERPDVFVVADAFFRADAGPTDSTRCDQSLFATRTRRGRALAGALPCVAASLRVTTSPGEAASRRSRTWSSSRSLFVRISRCSSGRELVHAIRSSSSEIEGMSSITVDLRTTEVSPSRRCLRGLRGDDDDMLSSVRRRTIVGINSLQRLQIGTFIALTFHPFEVNACHCDLGLLWPKSIQATRRGIPAGAPAGRARQQCIDSAAQCSPKGWFGHD